MATDNAPVAYIHIYMYILNHLIRVKQICKVAHNFRICVAHACLQTPHVTDGGFRYDCLVRTDVDKLEWARTSHTEYNDRKGAVIVCCYHSRESSFFILTEHPSTI